MRYDEAKIDEAVLAFHERGLIDDPKNKNKSVIFTEEGLALARASAERLFSSSGSPTASSVRQGGSR
jgi:hypothetical protein